MASVPSSHPVHIGWDKVKVGDRVKYHSPVQGNHRGIVVKIRCSSVPFSCGSRVYVQPITTAAAERGVVEHDLMTVNHSLWEIY